jgi:hypothetical protein
MQPERRSNVTAGVIVVAGALMLALTSRLSWAQLTIPALNVRERALYLDAVPGIDLGGDTVDFRGWLLGAALAVGVLGLLLVGTRVRGLGFVWRICVLLVLVFPANLVLSLWRVAVEPTGVSSASPAFWKAIHIDQAAALADLGELEIDGTSGLILMVLGTVCSFLGCCVPAVRERSPAEP